MVCKRQAAVWGLYMKTKILMPLLITAAALSGCSKGHPYDAETDVFWIEGTKVSVGMTNALFYAFEEQQNSQNQPMFGDQFWNSVCFENPDMTYGEYEKEFVFFENLMNMFCLSKIWESSHTLSSEETELIARYAGDYMAGLDQETSQFLGLSQEDALALCEACYCALNMQQELGNQTSMVISEEEIRVVTVLEAYFQTREEAEAYISGLDEGQDPEILSSAAVRVSQENLTREEIESDSFREAVFSLREGMHTDVLGTEDGYLVAVLMDAFQDELSEAHRQELLSARRQERISQACEDYRAEAEIYISQELWQSYAFKTEELPEGVLNINDTFNQMEEIIEDKDN